jgi:hypothetical protein
MRYLFVLILIISTPSKAEYKVVEGTLWNKEQMGISATIKNSEGERQKLGAFFLLQNMTRNPNFVHIVTDSDNCKFSEKVVSIKLNDVSYDYREYCQFRSEVSEKVFMYIPNNASTSMEAFKELSTSQNHLKFKSPRIQSNIPMEGFVKFWEDISEGDTFTLIHENEWFSMDMGSVSTSVYASSSLKIESISGYMLVTDDTPYISIQRESFPSSPCISDQLSIVSVNGMPIKMKTNCSDFTDSGFSQIYYSPSSLKGREFLIQSLLESDGHVYIKFSEFSGKLSTKGFKEQYEDIISAL